MLRDWSGIAEVEKAALFSLVNQILKSEEAPRRTWMCEECHTEQDYPFADAAAIDALSVDQQKALFIRLSALYTMAHENAQSHCTGSSCPPQVPTQVAQWALPYKERIRHAEALARRDGDFDRALVELLALQEVLPTAAIVLMDIGACHGEKQQNAEALSWLEKALQFVPPEYEHRVQQNIACIESRLEEQR
jgi:tetratricopeptide (TPR) repeat protein